MACSDAHVEMQAKYDARNPDALRRLVGNGVQVRPFPKEVGVAAWKASNDIYAELSEKNAKWKKIYASFVKFRDDQILWSRFSEGAYESLLLQLRNPSTKG
jgi:TRAP-type mannitol/chloroaromatic compound transport system substrate-binding protein